MPCQELIKGRKCASRFICIISFFNTHFLCRYAVQLECTKGSKIVAVYLYINWKSRILYIAASNSNYGVIWCVICVSDNFWNIICDDYLVVWCWCWRYFFFIFVSLYEYHHIIIVTICSSKFPHSSPTIHTLKQLKYLNLIMTLSQNENI